MRMILISVLTATAIIALGCDGGTPAGTGGGGGGGGSADGGGGSGGAAAAKLNGCTAADAEDHGADASVTIGALGTKYDKPCIKISAGAQVVFSMDFTIHPLVGGEVIDGSKFPDDASPIPATATGTEVAVSFPNAGEFPFYCDVHGTFGMAGAVYVE